MNNYHQLSNGVDNPDIPLHNDNKSIGLEDSNLWILVFGISCSRCYKRNCCHTRVKKEFDESSQMVWEEVKWHFVVGSNICLLKDISRRKKIQLIFNTYLPTHDQNTLYTCVTKLCHLLFQGPFSVLFSTMKSQNSSIE